MRSCFHRVVQLFETVAGMSGVIIRKTWALSNEVVKPCNLR